MSYVAAALSVLAALTGIESRAMSRPAGNPIIGEWILTQGVAATCGSELRFTATSETDIYPDGKYNRTHPVRYNVSAGLVYTMENTASAVGYRFQGQNTMTQQGVRYSCVYQRKGTTPVSTNAPRGNALMGIWKLAASQPRGCYTSFNFSGNQQIATDASGEIWKSELTGYEVAGNVVTANGSAGGQSYRITSAGTMEENKPGGCHYSR
jgi:hypothetical protein